MATEVSGRPRGRQIVVFVTVVWSIGAIFLALDTAMTELTSIGSSKLFPATLVLHQQSRAAFQHCQETLKNLQPPPQDASRAGPAWYFAWILGYTLGTADGAMSTGAADRAAVDGVLRQSLAATGWLGIPPIALPQHGRNAYRLAEFSDSLEEDPQCVAATFQFRFSSRHAALYKFGAAVGIAESYRLRSPDLGSVLAPQLRIYGSAAGIPPDLYAPLLQGPAASRGTSDGQMLRSAVNRIDAYVKSTH